MRSSEIVLSPTAKRLKRQAENEMKKQAVMELLRRRGANGGEPTYGDFTAVVNLYHDTLNYKFINRDGLKYMLKKMKKQNETAIKLDNKKQSVDVNNDNDASLSFQSNDFLPSIKDGDSNEQSKISISRVSKEEEASCRKKVENLIMQAATDCKNAKEESFPPKLPGNTLKNHRKYC
jgi:ATP-dependent exoDNAse (exonuclease V) alpha subunit